MFSSSWSLSIPKRQGNCCKGRSVQMGKTEMEKNYPLVKQNMCRGTKVGISAVNVCGNLHRTFQVIYTVPGDWVNTPLKWCEDVQEAMAEVLLNEYEIVRCDFFDWPWLRM